MLYNLCYTSYTAVSIKGPCLEPPLATRLTQPMCASAPHLLPSGLAMELQHLQVLGLRTGRTRRGWSGRRRTSTPWGSCSQASTSGPKPMAKPKTRHTLWLLWITSVLHERSDKPSLLLMDWD